jgi:methionyl-tRNA synthetase
MWQAMLMAVKLPPSKQIIIDGFVTGEGGIKMSKSLGNTIDPLDVVKNYGTDALRYYVCREVAPFDDSPFTMEKFKDAYNAHLANGLGNLVSRVMKMAEANSIKYNQNIEKKLEETEELLAFYKKYNEGFVEYNLEKASAVIWDIVSGSDKIIQERQPFKKIKTDKNEGEKDIKELLARLNIIAKLLVPFMPETSKKIFELIQDNKMPATPIFLRK